MATDPFEEIRLVSLRSVRGANFWSAAPVTRLDLSVGAYDEISSADVPGFTEQMLAALPGLVEHRCSIGERGGFVTRLRRGTFAPHIVEHVALELQSVAGHAVGYGKARGGDRPGEYTVVFEHLHTAVGLRAAAHALELVRRAFAGTLADAEAEVAELASLAAIPDLPRLQGRVLCGVTGGGDRAAVRAEIARRVGDPGEQVVDVSPAFLLEAGLPYSRSATAVILDSLPRDVPDRYREPDRARQLLSVLADGVPRDGVVVVPADDSELQALVLEARRRVAVFSADGRIDRALAAEAHAAAWVRGGRIVLERGGEESDGGEIRPGTAAEAQVAAGLACFVMEDQRAPTAGANG